MICSPLESNCVPLPQWERPASPVGHVRPRRAPICGWFVLVIIMMSMIIHGTDHGDRDDSPELHTFGNVPSQSPGDFDEDCHQNDYYHDLLWCSWSWLSWLVWTGLHCSKQSEQWYIWENVHQWVILDLNAAPTALIHPVASREVRYLGHQYVRRFSFVLHHLHRHNHHLLSLCVFILSFFLRLKTMQLKHPNKSIFQLVAEKLGVSNLLKIKILLMILSLLCSK